jgi:hypothetical protein
LLSDDGNGVFFIVVWRRIQDPDMHCFYVLR